MAAAEIMNLNTRFFDEVYENNFMIDSYSDENDEISTDINCYTFNNTTIDKSKLLRISSVDSNGVDRTNSSGYGSNSPLTDTTNDDDIDWAYISEEEGVEEEESGNAICTTRNGVNELKLYSSDRPVMNCLDSSSNKKKFIQLQKRQPSMIYAAGNNINHDNKSNNKSNNTSNNTSKNNKSTWNPFGIPIPPSLVWFTVMKQQIQQLPITRQDVNHKIDSVDAKSSTLPLIKDTVTPATINSTRDNSIIRKTTPATTKPILSTEKNKKKPYTTEERKQRNREAAAQSRVKKKKQMQYLKDEILRLKNLVLEKDKSIEKLECENLNLKSQLGLVKTAAVSIAPGSIENITSTNIITDDNAIKQPLRKRKRIANNSSYTITNSLKVGVACSIAMCLFTDDGTSTAFVFDHVSHIHKHILFMKYTNWVFTILFCIFFFFSYSLELRKCREKTTRFLLPLFMNNY